MRVEGLLIQVSYEGVWSLKRSQELETEQEKYSEIPICDSKKVILNKPFLTYHNLLWALKLAIRMSKYANATSS